MPLGLRRVFDEHTGENIAESVLQVIMTYGIQAKIGYFMLDNAGSNDTAVDAILKQLFPLMKKEKRKQRRLRCLGHVINLAAQTFILGKNSEKVLDELSAKHAAGDWTGISAIWKKHGPIGKLHNLVRYIRMTPQRRQEFADIKIGGDLEDYDKLQVSCAPRPTPGFTDISTSLFKTTLHVGTHITSRLYAH